jgi:ELWxxDGT repeat protein
MTDIAGNTIQTANTTSFSNIRPRPTRVLDRVGPDDRDDFYRIRLTGRTSLEITMDRLQANANLELLNQRGNVLERSTRNGTQDEAISRTLNEGTYFLRVFTPNRNADTRYRLVVSGFADRGGDNFNQASRTNPVQLTVNEQGNVEGGLTRRRDYVGPSDLNDFYRFQLDSFANVDLTLANLNSNVRMILFDGDRNRINAEARGSSGRRFGFSRDLEPGEYVVRILPVGNGSATQYRFDLVTSQFTDGAGNTFNQATDIGTLPLRSANDPIPTTRELLDLGDTDVYRFTTASQFGTLLTASLNTNLNVSFAIFDSNEQEIGSTSGSGALDLSDIALDADSTYFLKVSKDDATAFGLFDLNLSTEANIIDQAGNTPGAAFDIDAEAPSWTPATPGGQRQFSINEFVGTGLDDDDFYKFTLSEASALQLNLSAVDNDELGNTRVQLLRQSGDSLNLVETVLGTNSGAALAGTFDAGTYFINIQPRGNNTFTFYDLSLEAQSVELTPAFVRDLNPGSANSGVTQTMAGLGGTLFFGADDGSGVGLWKTNGTFDGTERIGTQSFSSIGEMVSVNGFVYFVGATQATGAELWRTNGTNVQLVRDIFPGETGSNINSFTVVGDYLYFVAQDVARTAGDGTTLGFNAEVWVVDTTFTGPLANSLRILDVTNPDGDNVGSNPTGLTAVGNTLYFFANDVFGVGETIFKSVEGGDPVALDLGLVSPLGSFVAFDDKLFFTGEEFTGIGASTRNIFFLDASDTLDSIPASGSYELNGFGNLTAAGGRLFFTGNAGSGTELYAYDPTLVGAAQTYLVRDIRIPTMDDISSNSNPRNLTAVGDLLYFTADDGSGEHLWVSNGTEAGTQKVLFEGDPITNVGNLTTVGSTLYFTADDRNPPAENPGTDLWRIFANGSVDFVGLSNNQFSSNPGDLTEVNGRLYFRAETPEVGRELWVVGLPVEEL